MPKPDWFVVSAAAVFGMYAVGIAVIVAVAVTELLEGQVRELDACAEEIEILRAETQVLETTIAQLEFELECATDGADGRRGDD